MSRLLKGYVQYNTNRGKTYTCPRCLTKSTTEERFMTHKEIGDSLGITQRVNYQSGKNNEIKKIYFDKFKKMWPVPFIVYADFQSCLELIEGDTHGKSKKYREHKPISYAFSVGGQWIRDGIERLNAIQDLIV